MILEGKRKRQLTFVDELRLERLDADGQALAQLVERDQVEVRPLLGRHTLSHVLVGEQLVSAAVEHLVAAAHAEHVRVPILAHNQLRLLALLCCRVVADVSRRRRRGGV